MKAIGTVACLSGRQAIQTTKYLIIPNFFRSKGINPNSDNYPQLTLFILPARFSKSFHSLHYLCTNYQHGNLKAMLPLKGEIPGIRERGLLL
jgi:hypothetical protein